jgi:hypothetical protein
MVRDSVALTNTRIGNKPAEWKGLQAWSGHGMYRISIYCLSPIRPLRV